jgi:acid phosphatase
MQNTLLFLTFDEDKTSTDRNTVFGLLLGDALPPHSAGTTDGNYYNHYSQISTIEANWHLHTLGRWDVGANVFSFAVNKKGGSHRCDAPKAWSAPPPFNAMFFNESYPGPLNSVNSHVPWPAPDVQFYRGLKLVFQSCGFSYSGS